MTNTSQSTQQQPATVAGVASGNEQAVAVRFGFKQNEAYDLSLRFQVIVQRAFAVGCTATLGQQLECASLSLLLNVAEGYGSSREVRAGALLAAYGAGLRCTALLDVLYLRGVVVAADTAAGSQLLSRLLGLLAVGRPPFVSGRPARPCTCSCTKTSGLRFEGARLELPRPVRTVAPTSARRAKPVGLGAGGLGTPRAGRPAWRG